MNIKSLDILFSNYKHVKYPKQDKGALFLTSKAKLSALNAYSYIMVPLHEVIVNNWLEDQDMQRLKTILSKVVYDSRNYGVKLGDIILRINKYEKLEPFGCHYDIDLKTYAFMNVSSEGKVTYPTNEHKGEQMTLLGLGKPEKHVFNPNGVRYSIVIFVNAHFSQALKDSDTTIGDYLNSLYYS